MLHFPRVQIEVAFGGLGMLSTAYLLGNRLNAQPPVQLAIQAGIAGAIDRSLPLGQVVNVVSEQVGDLGAEDRGGELLSLADIGFSPGLPYDTDGRLRPAGPAAILPFSTVAGLTVQRASGSEATIARLRHTFPTAQVESMEGAAFFYACLAAGVDALQLRGISNYVEPRNRAGWRMAEAIRAANEALRRVLGPFLD